MKKIYTLISLLFLTSCLPALKDQVQPGETYVEGVLDEGTASDDYDGRIIVSSVDHDRQLEVNSSTTNVEELFEPDPLYNGWLRLKSDLVGKSIKMILKEDDYGYQLIRFEIE